MSYSVSLWGSRPGDNDDCNTGEDFRTLDAARATYQEVIASLEAKERIMGCTYRNTMYVEIDGPDVHEEYRVQSFSPERDDNTWNREYAMQQGMAFGCAGYNDAMGY